MRETFMHLIQALIKNAIKNNYILQTKQAQKKNITVLAYVILKLVICFNFY